MPVSHVLTAVLEFLAIFHFSLEPTFLFFLNFNENVQNLGISRTNFKMWIICQVFRCGAVGR